MAVGHQGIQCISLISFTPVDRTRLRKPPRLMHSRCSSYAKKERKSNYMKRMIIGVLFSLVYNFSVGQAIAVEQVAEFPGGLSKFYEFLSKNIKYPKDARKKGISGKVYIEFFIKENGEIDKDSLRAVPKEEIIKSIGAARASDIVIDESLELEAMRVIRNSPKWIPGSRRDVPVRQKIVLPIEFKR